MSKSKLLKEAIADAKAVRETAIANAKIALEEAFTPRLQSILSRKLQAEMEEEEFEDDAVELEEEYGAEDVSGADSSDIGAGEGDTESGTDGSQPTGGAYQDATKAHTKLDPETTKQTAPLGKEDEDMPLAEGEDEMEFDLEEEEEMDFDLEEEEEMDFELEEEDEDELDLEAIIRELEGEDEEHLEEFDADGDGVQDDPTGASYEDPAHGEDLQTEEDEELDIDLEEDEDFDDEIDLDEILREMGYGDDEEEVHTEEEDVVDNTAELEAELEEAYSTIKSLRKTINEVNLLNAKLLYTNKLFRGYNLTNEQKVKVVENLDRTSSVREVKLVYATLAESMKFGGTEKKASIKKSITEGLASKKVASTAPKKEVITESGDTIADRFKKLAGII
jgi:hypothetical protein